MADTNKLQVMTLGNLQKYDGLIKNYIDVACAEVDEKLLKTVALVNGKLCFYNVEEPVGATTPVFEITLPEADLSGLMSKLPTNAVENNIVVVGTNGEVKDSGIAVADVAIKSEVNTAISNLQSEVDEIKDDYLKAADKTELESKIKTNTDAIAVLNGTGDGSVKKTVDAAINEFATNVTDDAVVNSYKELIDWAAEHGGEAAEMAAGIEANKTSIQELADYVGTLPEGEVSATVVEYIQKLVSAEETRAKGVEAELDGKIASAIETAAADATEKANQALADSKTYTDTEVAKDRARLDAAEADILALEESLADGGATSQAIAEAKKAGTDAQATADEAKGLATTNATDISNLTTRVTNNEENIKGLQGEVSTVSGNVNALGDRVTQTETDIEALQEKVDTLEKSGYDDTELRGLIDTNTQDITNLKAKDNELAGQISSVSGSVASLTDRTSAVETKVNALEGSMTTVQGDVADLKTTVGTHTTEIDALKGRTTTLENSTTTLRSDLDKTSESVDTNTQNIASLTTTVNSNTDRITALEEVTHCEAIPDSEITALFEN